MGKPNPTAPEPNTEAGKFLRDLATEWSTARDDLEKKWNRNRDHFNRVFSKVFKEKDGEGWRSRAVPGYLRQKVLTAYALMVDLVLQNGQVPFGMKPSRRLQRSAGFNLDTYKESIKAAEDRIRDQFSLCHADRSMMSHFMAGALYGRTWAKKTRGIFSESGYEPLPVPGVDDVHSINPDTLQYQPYETEYTGPAWEYASNWEMFTDPEWENPRDPNSTGTFQQRPVTARWLRDKRSSPYYIGHNIDLVIKRMEDKHTTPDAGNKGSLPPYQREIQNAKRNIVYREWCLWMPRDIAEITEVALTEQSQGKWVSPETSLSPKDDGDDVYVIACTANDEIVRWVRANQREFPWFMCDWDKAVDEAMPNGVADNAEFAQSLLAGGLRMFINNKRLTANMIAAINPKLFANPPGELEPGLLLHTKNTADDLDKAIKQLTLDDVGESLLSLIGLAEKYGDWDTLIPKISQGLEEPQGQQTAYEISQQIARADKYSAAVARNFDEHLIEPMGTEFHRDNMEDPAITDGRGDYIIEAQGFQAVQDRIFRVAIYRQLLDLAVSSPELYRRAKIGKMLEHLTRAMTADPADFWIPDEELPEPEQGPSPEEQEAAAVQTDAVRAKAARDMADAEAKRSKAITDAAKVELEAERQEKEQAEAMQRQLGLAE